MSDRLHDCSILTLLLIAFKFESIIAIIIIIGWLPFRLPNEFPPTAHATHMKELFVRNPRTAVVVLYLFSPFELSVLVF